MASTKDVLDHHLKAFDQGDLNGILSDYAPDAVFFTKNGALKGVDKIRPLFEALIAEFGKPGATFNVKQQLVEADYAYILWTAESDDLHHAMEKAGVMGAAEVSFLNYTPAT